jgi:hypothetical protein
MERRIYQLVHLINPHWREFLEGCFCPVPYAVLLLIPKIFHVLFRQQRLCIEVDVRFCGDFIDYRDVFRRERAYKQQARNLMRIVCIYKLILNLLLAGSKNVPNSVFVLGSVSAVHLKID